MRASFVLVVLTIGASERYIDTQPQQESQLRRKKKIHLQFLSPSTAFLTTVEDWFSAKTRTGAELPLKSHSSRNRVPSL